MRNENSVFKVAAAMFSATLLLSLSAEAAWAAKSPKPTDELSRPIPLGSSGSSLEHIVIGDTAFCYRGTLGSLVTDGSSFYILSNNHILAKENVPNLEPPNDGSILDTILAVDGFDVIQPSLFDEKGPCGLGDASNKVATTTDWVELLFDPNIATPASNTVDAAVAEINGAGDVDVDGAILDIGTVSATTHSVVPGDVDVLNVQKAGATSRHTFGLVTAIDAAVIIEYDHGFALFTNQIEITGNCGDPFGEPGDSGSLILNVPADGDRQAVGLLFAGTSDDSLTFANPIDDVLTA